MLMIPSWFTWKNVRNVETSQIFESNVLCKKQKIVIQLQKQESVDFVLKTTIGTWIGFFFLHLLGKNHQILQIH